MNNLNVAPFVFRCGTATVLDENYQINHASDFPDLVFELTAKADSSISKYVYLKYKILETATRDDIHNSMKHPTFAGRVCSYVESVTGFYANTKDNVKYTIIPRGIRIGNLYSEAMKVYATMTFGFTHQLKMFRKHCSIPFKYNGGVYGTWEIGEDKGIFSVEGPSDVYSLQLGNVKTFEASLQEEFMMRWPHMAVATFTVLEYSEVRALAEALAIKWDGVDSPSNKLFRDVTRRPRHVSDPVSSVRADMLQNALSEIKIENAVSVKRIQTGLEKRED